MKTYLARLLRQTFCWHRYYYANMGMHYRCTECLKMFHNPPLFGVET